MIENRGLVKKNIYINNSPYLSGIIKRIQKNKQTKKSIAKI